MPWWMNSLWIYSLDQPGARRGRASGNSYTKLSVFKSRVGLHRGLHTYTSDYRKAHCIKNNGKDQGTGEKKSNGIFQLSMQEESGRIVLEATYIRDLLVGDRGGWRTFMVGV